MHSEWLRCTPYSVRSGVLVCIYQRDMNALYDFVHREYK